MKISTLLYVMFAWTALWLALGVLGGLGPVELGVWLVGLILLGVGFALRRRHRSVT